jgi:hypothetical protein
MEKKEKNAVSSPIHAYVLKPSHALSSEAKHERHIDDTFLGKHMGHAPEAKPYRCNPKIPR